MKTARSARQNDSFRAAEWAVLRRKMGHFEKRKEKSSGFVRLFLRNNRFRHRRMKKNEYPFFRYEILTIHHTNLFKNLSKNPFIFIIFGKIWLSLRPPTFSSSTSEACRTRLPAEQPLIQNSR